MNQYYTFPLYVMFCMLLYACSNDDKEAEPLRFQVSISNIEAYQATATITHNGTNRDNYYAFAVEGHVGDVGAEINKFLLSSNASSILNSPYQQRKKVVKVNGLKPHRTFTYIVFGLDQQQKLYGEPAAIEFSTTGSRITATENPNWTMTYKGHTVYNDWDYSLINVHVEGEVAERYFVTVLDASTPSIYNSVEELISQAVDDFTNQRNVEGDKDFWLDASQVRTESTNFYRYLEPGDYVAYAIGLNADGSPTGHYAKSDPFHVDQYPYTEVYASLVDDSWYFIDANNKGFYVTFKPSIVNRSLKMTGWGNYKNLEITVNYDRNTNGLTIHSGRITTSEVTLHFSKGNETGIVYLFGAYYNADDELRWTNQSHVIAKGKWDADGNYEFTPGYYVTLDDSGTKASQLGMSFVMYQNGSPALGFSRMMFPFFLKKEQ